MDFEDTNALEHLRLSRLAARLATYNLIDSNFHANGFVPPAITFTEASNAYFKQRKYAPDSQGEVPARQAIADFYKHGGPISTALSATTHLTANQIVICASSSEAYSLLFATFCEPGDNVLIPLPAYPLFEDLLAHHHLEPRFYLLDSDQSWDIDLELVDALWDAKTTFMVVVSPNNPCGSVLSATTLQGLATIAQKADFAIIHDEVFSEFLYHGTTHQRAAEWCPDVPVFTLNGISKLFASPDLKLGWILCTGPSAISSAEILGFRNDTFLSANGLSQFILPRLFQDLDPFVNTMRSQLEANLDLFRQTLLVYQKTGLCWQCHFPKAGIHGVLEYSGSSRKSDEEWAIALLDQFGLYLHPGYFYGIEDRTCLVFSFLKAAEEWNKLVPLLFQALNQLN